MPAVNGLADTGERGVPPSAVASLAERLVFLKHQTMYAWTAAWTSGRQVLDLGCGEGYGSRILAEAASRVVAADYAPLAARHVQAAYGGPRLSSLCCNGERLAFAAASFDVVVSFEVIEHIPNVEPYLREVQRVLRPGGAFLVSSPNRRMRPHLLGRPWNPHHLREYTAAEYAQVLRLVFSQVVVYGVSAIPPIVAIEVLRVRRAALRSWSTRLGRRILPGPLFSVFRGLLQARRRSAASSPGPAAPDPLAANGQPFTPADFSINDHDLDKALNLVAVCTL